MLVMLVIDHIIIMKMWHYKGFMRLRFQREKMSVGAPDTLLPSERLFEVLQSPVKTSSRQFLIPYKYLLPHFSFNIAPFLFQYCPISLSIFPENTRKLVLFWGVWKRNIDPKWVNPLSANPTHKMVKHSNNLPATAVELFSVFDHF